MNRDGTVCVWPRSPTFPYYGFSASRLKFKQTIGLLVLHIDLDVHSKRFKSSLAFRKAATHAVIRHPARPGALMIGLDGHASLDAGRRPWRAVMGYGQGDAPKA